MSHFAAVLDANVLYSYPLTTVLLELAEARLYRPIWSADIHDEWVRNLKQNRSDLDPAKIDRRRAAMDAALPDACVTGYQRLVPSLDLPDANDRHVLAAAIRSKAQVIVTFNEKHFPVVTLDEFDLCTQHPDTFLRHLIDLAPNLVLSRLLTMIEALRRPAMSANDYIAMLERQSLPESAAALRGLLLDRA